MMVCIWVSSNRLSIHSTRANRSSLSLTILASGSLRRCLTLLGVLLSVLLRCHHHLLYLLALFALALSLAAFAFVVVLLVRLLATGVEVGLRLVRPWREGRRVGVLDLIAGACVAILRLRCSAVKLALLPLRR